jgi:hypothetical protein
MFDICVGIPAIHNEWWHGDSVNHKEFCNGSMLSKNDFEGVL